MVVVVVVAEEGSRTVKMATAAAAEQHNRQRNGTADRDPRRISKIIDFLKRFALFSPSFWPLLLYFSINPVCRPEFPAPQWGKAGRIPCRYLFVRQVPCAYQTRAGILALGRLLGQSSIMSKQPRHARDCQQESIFGSLNACVQQSRSLRSRLTTLLLVRVAGGVEARRRDAMSCCTGPKRRGEERREAIARVAAQSDVRPRCCCPKVPDWPLCAGNW